MVKTQVAVVELVVADTSEEESAAVARLGSLPDVLPCVGKVLSTFRYTCNL